MPAKARNYSDYENHYLKVVEHSHVGAHGHHFWVAKCKACGRHWTVRGAHIMRRKSCGCRQHTNAKRDGSRSMLLRIRWV